MKTLITAVVLALLGFGGGLLSIAPSSPMFFRPGAQVRAGSARVVPLLAVYDNRSANPDGSGVYSVTYLIAARRDGSRAMISTWHFGKGWLKTRRVYNPATRVSTDIRDDLGIKTTWPGQATDTKSIITPGCPQLAGSQTIQVLGHKAVHDWHTGGGDEPTVLDGWRIPELGCLRALLTFRYRSKDGSFARNGEDRLVWLSETDPPNSFFEVSPQLEEVSPVEAFPYFIRAGLWNESEPVPFGAQQSDVAYAYWNGKIDRPQAMTTLHQLEADQVPSQR